MVWSIRGWFRYIRGVIFRRFNTNENLLSSIFYVALLILCIYTFHFNGAEKGKAGLESMGLSLGPQQQYGEHEIAKEKIPDYTGFVGSNRNKFSPKKKNTKSNIKKFIPKGPKPGGIGKRKDKLAFAYSKPKKSSDNDQAKPAVNIKSIRPSKTYQEDVVIGDKIEWTLEAEQERRREMRQRSMRIQRQCEADVRGRLRRRHLGKNYEELNLKWVPRYEIIYCPIFKAASTTWMKNLVSLSGETKFEGSIHRKASSLYPPPNSRQRSDYLMDKSIKFMIVRNPFDRLLSAYRDKMLRELKVDDPYRRMQTDIILKYRLNTNNRLNHTAKEEETKDNPISTTAVNSSSLTNSTFLLEETSHPSFLQFLYKVRDDLKAFLKRIDGSLVDPHWMPFWYSCAPCQIKYDIIAKMESLDLDQEFLLHATNLQDTLPNVRSHASKFDGYSDTDASASEYFKGIPMDLLKELENLYLPDFQLFGYSANKYFNIAQEVSIT